MSRLATNVPVPGQSLTQAPSARLPHERPPTYTEPNQAISFIFDDLTSKQKMPHIVRVLKENKAYIDVIVGAYIEEGLVQGKWNVDLAHLLVEPVLFIFIWIASQIEAPLQFKHKKLYSTSGVDVLAESKVETSEDLGESLLAPSRGNE